jgi:hypothetical protein
MAAGDVLFELGMMYSVGPGRVDQSGEISTQRQNLRSAPMSSTKGPKPNSKAMGHGCANEF